MTKELTGNEIKSTINENFHTLIDSVESDHIVLKNEKEKLLSFFDREEVYQTASNDFLSFKEQLISTLL